MVELARRDTFLYDSFPKVFETVPVGDVLLVLALVQGAVLIKQDGSLVVVIG